MSMSGGDSNMDAIFTLNREELAQLFGGRTLLDLIPLSPEPPFEPRISPAQQTKPQAETSVEAIKVQPASSSTMTGTSTIAPKGQQNLQPLVSQQPQPILYQLLNGELLPLQNGTKPTTASQTQSVAGQGNRQDAAQQHGQPLVNQICQLLANGSLFVPTTLQQTAAGQPVVYQVIQLQPNSQPLADRSPVQPVTSPGGKHQEVAQTPSRTVVLQLQPSTQPALNGAQTTLPQTSLTSGHQGNRKTVATQQPSQLLLNLPQLTSQPSGNRSFTQPQKISQTSVGQGNNPEVGQSRVNQHHFQPNVVQLQQSSNPLAEPNYMVGQEEAIQRHVQPPVSQCYVPPQQNSQPSANSNDVISHGQATVQKTRDLLVRQGHHQEEDVQCLVPPQQNSKPSANRGCVISHDQAIVEKARNLLFRQGHHQEEAAQRHVQPSVRQCYVPPQQNGKPSASSCVVSHDQATGPKTRRSSVCRGNKSLVNPQPSQPMAILLQRDSQPLAEHVCMQPLMSRVQAPTVRQGNRQEFAAQPRDLPLVQRCSRPPHTARYYPYPSLLTCPCCEQRCYCPTCSYTGPPPPQRCWTTGIHDEIQPSARRYQPYPNTQCMCHPCVPQQAGDHGINFPCSFSQTVNPNHNPNQLNQLIAEPRTGPIRVLNGRMVYEITLEEQQ